MNKVIPLLILIFGVGIVGTNEAVASYDCDGYDMSLGTTLLCFVQEIHRQNYEIKQQNEEILEKLDWTNCAILNKRTTAYCGGSVINNEVIIGDSKCKLYEKIYKLESHKIQKILEEALFFTSCDYRDYVEENNYND